jgi:hypothetical protein
MSAQPLNYCRSLVRQLRPAIDIPSNVSRERMIHVLDLVNASQKFCLPSGGRLLEDMELRGLDTTDLSLPFPFIALEYQADIGINLDAPYKCSKRIVLARQDNGLIRCTSVLYVDSVGLWSILPDFGFDSRDWRFDIGVSGRTGMNIMRVDERIPVRDYADEAGAVLHLLNALSCTNVRTIRSIPKIKAKTKDALPFDSYHFLTIDSSDASGAGVGGHRSPREHLRRGHIRRISSGRRLWINATVVAANRGAGKITKDYGLAGPKE